MHGDVPTVEKQLKCSNRLQRAKREKRRSDVVFAGRSYRRTNTGFMLLHNWEMSKSCMSYPPAAQKLQNTSRITRSSVSVTAESLANTRSCAAGNVQKVARRQVSFPIRRVVLAMVLCSNLPLPRRTLYLSSSFSLLAAFLYLSHSFPLATGVSTPSGVDASSLHVLPLPLRGVESFTLLWHFRVHFRVLVDH